MKTKRARRGAVGTGKPADRLDVLSPEDWAMASVIGHFRRHLKLSLHEAARLGGISRQMFSYVERGLRLPTCHTLGRIAQALGVTSVRLMQLARRWQKLREAKNLPPRG